MQANSPTLGLISDWHMLESRCPEQFLLLAERLDNNDRYRIGCGACDGLLKASDEILN